MRDRSSLRSSDRRYFVQGAALAATGLATGRARAQQPARIRAMTLQRSPEQLAAYAKMVSTFEAAHPGIKVAVEPIAETDLWPKLAASYAGGDVPDLVLQLTAPPTISLYNAGLLLPMDDVVNALGESDFAPETRNLYKDKGSYYAACTSNNCVSLLWYRKDLLEQEGLAVPQHWDELVAVAKKLTKNGKYGTSLPYGKTAMTNSITWTLIYQAGGLVIAPDNSVVFNSDATVAALEFLKEMHQYAPPGANRYDFFDVLNAFVTGASATTMYTGRAITNVNANNPALADKISCVPYPYMRGGKPWWSGAFECIVVPKGAKNVEAAKLFAAWNFKLPGYTDFINATPAHQIPTLQSVLKSPQYLDDPILKKYPKELQIEIDTLSKSHSTAKPFDDSPLIGKAGDIQGSGIFAEVIQRVVIEGQSAKSAAIWARTGSPKRCRAERTVVYALVQRFTLIPGRVQRLRNATRGPANMIPSASRFIPAQERVLRTFRAGPRIGFRFASAVRGCG